MHALIIGAGIHGCSIGMELAKFGYQVTIVDKSKTLLSGASYATHNRIHLGYHYPRSPETILECKRGYKLFCQLFSDCIIQSNFYYLVAKNDSFLNKSSYEQCLAQNDLPINHEWPDRHLIHEDQVTACYNTNEVCFDRDAVANKLAAQLTQLGVSFLFNFEITSATLSKGDKLILEDNSGKRAEFNPDVILNCTYAYANTTQTIFKVKEPLTEYFFRDTEIAVVKSNSPIPPLTIMDGKFITILPYIGYPDHYLVYDVEHSNSGRREKVNSKHLDHHESKWPLMQIKCNKYFTFSETLIYQYSLLSTRPVPTYINNDSRQTRIIQHDYPIRFYSVLEGKFSTAPLTAKSMANLLELE